jgi:glycosyltransferase involved in cell wall biosynthesis
MDLQLDDHAASQQAGEDGLSRDLPLAGRVILQVLPALEEGGVERGAVEMTEAIARAGGQAIVASAGGRMVPSIERAGGTHVVIPLLTKDPLNILLNARRLRRLVVREQVDLVHARSRAPAWSALIAARRARVPFLTTWHGVYAENLPGKRLYNAVMAKGDRVIAISDFVGRRVAADYGVGPDRLRVIHRGADPAIFDPGRVNGDRLHNLAHAWRIPENTRIVLLPGRVTTWKGQALLVEALARLERRDAVAVFTGSAGPGLRALLAQAKAAGVAERTRFVGHCADMAAAYALADLVVAPSLKPEPFGRVVVEAQAMERLVIVADHGGAVETVEHGVSGWRIPPGDVEALAHAIDTGLSLSSEQRAIFGANARAGVLERFSKARMQAATIAVYGELLGIPALIMRDGASMLSDRFAQANGLANPVA